MTWDKHRVLQLRQTLGLTQAEMARELGCRQQTVSEWELGLYLPANAYGQLLSQFEQRVKMTKTSLDSSRSLRQKEKRSAEDVSGIDTLPELEENSFDKPFDPAID